MRQPVITLYRWILWLSFVVLWAVPSYLGLIATSLLVYSMPGIAVITVSALYLVGHLFLIRLAFQKGHWGILAVWGGYWLLGLIASIFWVCTGHSGIFIFFYVPLMMGAVTGKIGLFGELAIPLLHGLMALLCGVLVFRLWKAGRKSENPN